MKICWYDDQRLGVIKNDNGTDKVLDVTAALDALPAPRYPALPGDLLIAHLDQVCAAIKPLLATASGKPVKEARFLSPVANPGKIIGVPVNYEDHVAEAKADKVTFSTDRFKGGIEEQGLFLKATSSLVGPAEGIRLRLPNRMTHHEMELGVVIGKKASNVSEDDALSHIAGYALALDMTVRGTEDRSQRKSVDTYSVLGPWLVTADEIAHPQALDIRLRVNDELRQNSNTSQMIMGIARQIAWASSFYTLYPGDIIMTGTCAGVGPVVPGDVLHAEIPGIGSMDVAVYAADQD
jgi:2-keto-4-pentenoate hydratase/2-oxohepta-3-ene-1,7-dioic acid hydratase in catechol pathway